MTDAPVPRLRYVSDDELPEDLRNRRDPVTRVFGHHPELLKAWGLKSTEG